MNIVQLAQDYGLTPDEVRERWLVLRVALWKSDFKKFAKEAIRIRTKDSQLEPLILNESQDILFAAAQEQLDEEKWVRIIALKGRRQGFSTFVAARGYWRATLWDRQRIYLLSHEMASSNTLFDMVALMQEKHPFPPAVGADNAKELEVLHRGSTYQVATAGQKAGGRGGAVTFFHGSEASHWTNASEHFASSVQSVDEVRGVWGVLWTEPNKPLPFEEGIGTIEGWVRAPSEIWLETTSNGPTGEYWKRYMDAMKGIGRYKAVFAPWSVEISNNNYGDYTPFEEADEEGELSEREYQETYKLTDSQMLWRRDKIHELGSMGKFKQEYPIDVTEAFAAADLEGVFIKPNLVLRARKKVMEDPDAPLIIGVDPAGSGGDRFAVAYRRGDKILRVTHRNKLEHDEAVAWLASIIDEHKPSRMCIDRGSMGGNIISSLRNLDKKYADVIKGIDFGGTSRAKKATPGRAGPWNKRAEMYGDFRDWLSEGGCIPDDDDLASDISGPKQKWRANNDWLLESKTEMKARGIRSSDLSDACVLTFATREWFENWSKPKPVQGFGAGHLREVAASGIGDNDRYWEYSNSNTSWMG